MLWIERIVCEFHTTGWCCGPECFCRRYNSVVAGVTAWVAGLRSGLAKHGSALLRRCEHLAAACQHVVLSDSKRHIYFLVAHMCACSMQTD